MVGWWRRWFGRLEKNRRCRLSFVLPPPQLRPRWTQAISSQGEKKERRASTQDLDERKSRPFHGNSVHLFTCCCCCLLLLLSRPHFPSLLKSKIYGPSISIGIAAAAAAMHNITHTQQQHTWWCWMLLPGVRRERERVFRDRI